jgi:hypothetical protein
MSLANSYLYTKPTYSQNKIFGSEEEIFNYLKEQGIDITGIKIIC